MRMVGLKFCLELIFESECKKFGMLFHFRVHKGKIAFQECIATLHATKCIPDFRNSTNDPGQNKVDLKTPYSHGNSSWIRAKEVNSVLGPYCCVILVYWKSWCKCDRNLSYLYRYISLKFFICWRWIWIVKVLIPDAFVYVYSKLHVKHLEPVNELLKSYFKLFIKNVPTDLGYFFGH